VGIAMAFTMNGIGLNISTANLALDYTGTLTLPSTSLSPVSDSVISSTVSNSNVMKIAFTVKGASTNPSNKDIIYDVALADLNIDCWFRDSNVKWRLYKNSNLLSEGNLSPQFDTIEDGRLVLTNIQQDLPSYNSTADSYVFVLWISETCSDITACTSSDDQSYLLNKNISGKIEVELYTESKVARTRTAESNFSCWITSDTMDNSGANVPELVQGLIPVVYDGEKWVKAEISDTTSSYKWYDYDEKKWANAVLVTDTNRIKYVNATAGTSITESDILAYYVWIPRYKYKVWNINKVVGTDSYNARTTGIDIIFESGTNSTGTITCGTYSFAQITSDSQKSETCTGSNGEYYTHPAFTFGNDELTGIWVGKFEISSETPTANYGGGNSTALTVRVLPNVASWRNNYLTNFYKVIYDMQTSNNIYGLSNDRTNTDSHMMKNLEWGAVAYLTNSDYGLCTSGSCSEIGKNGYYNSSASNYNYYQTGCGPISSGSTSSGTTCNAYNTTIGQEASTTGNVYGIYDMSGGANEYVMGNESNQDYTQYVYYRSSAGSNFSYSSTTAKYIDTYAYGTAYSSQQAYNRARLGDATGEVVLTAGTSNGSWYGDYSSFVDSSRSWFYRGDAATGGSYAGVFSFYGGSGIYYFSNSARAVLVAPLFLSVCEDCSQN